MMTAARSPLPLKSDVISKRELDKLKQKGERLDKFLRIRIQRGSPKEEVGVWSDHCLHHEESFTDKRHYTIIVAPGHRDFIKNMTTDALQMGTALIMVPADGSVATAIAKDNHKTGEIQKNQTAFENDQHLGSETDPPRREQDGVRRCRQERYLETSNEMRSVLIKIGSNGFDQSPD